MKRFLSLALVFVLALGVALFGACVDKPEEPEVPKPHTEHTYSTEWSSDKNYHFKKCTHEGCNEVSEKALHNISDGVCSVCGYEKVENSISASSGTAVNIVSNAKDGDKIVLQPGVYPEITVGGVNGLTITAEEGAIVAGITVKSAISNLVIENVEFFNATKEAGVLIKGAVDGILIKNCVFEDLQIDAIKGAFVNNIVIENTVFKNFSKNVLSAIRIQELANFTMIGCEFDDIAYNAIQIGHYGIGGDIVIKNNTFKEIASRILYFVDTYDVLSCDISGNTFYDNSVCTHQTGKYVKAGGEGGIVVGINTWEVIPEAKETNFEGYNSGLVSYSVATQLQLS